MKILSLPTDKSGCGWYRVRKPLAGLKEYCGVDIHIYDNSKDKPEDLVRALPHFDAIFIRPGAEGGMFKIKEIKELSHIKAKWILDIDDNTDLISPYSQFYADFGLKEHKHGDEWIWRDGEKGFDIARNREKLASLKRGYSAVDMMITTTEKLAEHAREYNDNVYVNDNSIDMNHWWKLNNKINTPLKILWSGSPSHYEDFYAIKEPLQKLMTEYDFEVYMLGSNYSGIFKKEHLHRVHASPWVPFEAHSYRLMSMQADICMIPLADLPFNWYKSAIKWYEASAMGTPSVVSNVTPYKEVIQDGKTAMAYNTPNEFYSKMKQLIENKGLRQNIGNNALQWVKNNKTLEIESKKLYKRLEELCK